MMKLRWRRFPAGCGFETADAQFVAKYSVNSPAMRSSQKWVAEQVRLELGLDQSDVNEIKPFFGEDLAALSDVDFVHGRGEFEEYVYSPDIDDDNARRISLDFANAEPNRSGIDKFVRTWGIPAAGVITERQFCDMRDQVRYVLRSATMPKRLEMVFSLHGRGGYWPSNPFECSIRELEVLAKHGVLGRVRECESPECKRYYISNKRTADRQGRGTAAPQRFCCGNRARAKARRQREKVKNARGPSGKKVSADPKYARPAMPRWK
jgi:hypothetical protein